MRLVVVCSAKDVQVSADTAKVSVTHPTECALGAIANVASKNFPEPNQLNTLKVFPRTPNWSGLFAELWSSENAPILLSEDVV